VTRLDPDVFVGLPELPLPVLWRIGLRELALPTMAKVVGFTIDTYIGMKPSCRVAVATIADRANISARTVHGAQKILEEAEQLQIKPGGGSGRTNVYVRLFTPKTAQVVRRFFERAAETPQLTTETPHLRAINPAPAAGEVGLEVEGEIEGVADAERTAWPECDVCARRLPGAPYGDGLWLCDQHIATYQKAASGQRVFETSSADLENVGRAREGTS
jgi:hypothetical protein